MLWAATNHTYSPVFLRIRLVGFLLNPNTQHQEASSMPTPHLKRIGDFFLVVCAEVRSPAFDRNMTQPLNEANCGSFRPLTNTRPNALRLQEQHGKYHEGTKRHIPWEIGLVEGK